MMGRLTVEWQEKTGDVEAREKGKPELTKRGELREEWREYCTHRRNILQY
jgi:hypothetical protein